MGVILGGVVLSGAAGEEPVDEEQDDGAQNGDEPAHSSADSEKIPETMKSGMPIERPIAGSTEISPVLPIAVAAETAKMIAKDRRGRGEFALDMPVPA